MVSWIVVPLLGAFIGWITNVLAIRLLFRPRRAYKFLFWTIQGLIPKRRREMAASVAAVVDHDLLPPEEFWQRFATPEIEEQVVEVAVDLVRQRLEGRLPPFLPSPLKQAVGAWLEDAIRKEAPTLLAALGREVGTAPAWAVSLGAAVEEKLNGLDLAKVEELVVKVASRELRYIELLGGLLGFVIGVLQAAAIHLLP
ncbi:MAG TPA: DUF445 domain-containing protein [Peptococcaceae bacterium]|nr:DUF445 domain-containing protein [Peptococcaceae bacterium]